MLTKSLLLSGLLLMLTNGALAQPQWPAARTQDVASVDAIIAASYAAISHPAGKAADLSRFQSLFRPGAQLINLNAENGRPVLRAGSIEQITRMLKSTQHPERAHFEHEVARRTERFGNLAHVWSTYVSADRESKPKHVMRGINSISLVNDGNRWWIVSAQWQNESEQRPIPPRYLPRAK